MGTPPPALLPLLRSRVQGDLLALLYLHPEQEYSISEVATEIGGTFKAVHYEAVRLLNADLIRDRRQGNLRLIRVATDTVVARPLIDLLAVTHGPLPVLTDAPTNVSASRRRTSMDRGRHGTTANPGRSRQTSTCSWSATPD